MSGTTDITQDLTKRTSPVLNDELVMVNSETKAVQAVKVDTLRNFLAAFFSGAVIPQKINAGAVLGTPAEVQIYYAPAGSYTTPTGVVTLTGNLNMWFWNKVVWSYMQIPVSVDTTTIVADIANINTVQLPLKANKSDIINDLTTGGSTKMLSAEQGKLLNDAVVTRAEFEVVVGKQKFNKLDVTESRYIDWGNGTLAVNASYKASGWIPVLPSTNYYLVQISHYALYNSSKVFVSGQNYGGSAGTITTGATVAYIRVSIHNSVPDIAMVKLASDGTAYEPYTTTKVIKSDYLAQSITPTLLAYILSQYVLNIPDGNITPQKTSFVNTGAIVYGKNLFNKANITGGFFVNETNGVLNANAIYSVSASFIPVQPNTSYWLENINGHALYTSAFVFISGARSGSRMITTGATAAYIKVDAPTSSLHGMQVELGTTFTGYADYVPAYYPLSIPNLDVGANKVVDLLLPTEIFGVVGMQLNMYFQNFVIPEYADRLDKYIPQIGCTKGNTYQHFFRFTPTIAESLPFIFALNQIGRTVKALKSSTLKIAATASGTGVTRKLLMIGDSTADNEKMSTPIYDYFNTDAMDITLVGSRGTAGKKHEGHSGWSIASFATAGVLFYRFNVTGLAVSPSVGDIYSNNGSPWLVRIVNVVGGNGYIEFDRAAGVTDPILTASTLTKGSGAGPATIAYNTADAHSWNPFWNMTTNLFDFSMYLSNIGVTMSANDWVFFKLGINDMFYENTIAGAQAKASTMWTQLVMMMDNIQTVVPNIRIGVAATIPPAVSQDPFGSKYGNQYYRELYFKTGWLEWQKKLLTELDTSANKTAKRYYVPMHLNLDAVNDFPEANVDANSHNAKQILLQYDDVHVTVGGSANSADPVIAIVKYFA